MWTRVLGSDCVIRELSDEDAGPMFHAISHSRAHLRQWLPWVDTMDDEADCLAFIATTMAQKARNDGIQVGIWSGDEFAGVCGFHLVDWPNRRTSMGYWLAEDFVGRGLMRRTCVELVRYAFEDLRVNRVEIRAATENVRSRAIPQKLGFREEGCLREAEFLYDHYVDHVVYGMLAREFVTVGGRTR